MIGTIFNAKDLTQRLKATIQMTGKLGFTQDTIDQLRINQDKSIVMAPDDENANVLYMCVLETKPEYAFPILKSGPYFYLNTKQLFDKLERDYQKNVIIFDLSRCEKYDETIGGDCYKMTARVKVRTNESDGDSEE